MEGDSIRFTCLDYATGWHGLRFINAPDSSHLAYCIIEWGYATGVDMDDPDTYGGGFLCDGSNPVIEHCSIRNNRAEYFGGGFELINGSSPRIEYCEIADNEAEAFWGGGGDCYMNCEPQFRNCTFRNNQSLLAGGGLSVNYSSSAVVVDCHFIDNRSERAGGLLVQEDSAVRLERSLFAGNNAYEAGGAIECWINSSLTLANCTLYNNGVETIGGGILVSDDSHPVLVNTICWENYPVQVFLNPGSIESSITITHCDIDGGEDGVEIYSVGEVNWLEGNLDIDPLFQDAPAGDFILQPTSLCIDSGIDYFYWEGGVIVDIPPEGYFGTNPDMGAFEYDFGVYTELPAIQRNFTLYPAYPNPFNPVTNLSINLPLPSELRVTVYNTLGREVEILVDDYFSAGVHTLQFDGSNLTSGMYFIRAAVPGKMNQVRKTMLMK